MNSVESYRNYQTYVVLCYVINVMFLYNILFILYATKQNTKQRFLEYSLITVMNRDDFDQVACPICLESFQFRKGDLGKTVSLPCEHVFHYVCIKRWVRKSWMTQTPTCPMCRSECC